MGRQAALGQPSLPEKAISHPLFSLPASLSMTRPFPTAHTHIILFIDKTQNDDSKIISSSGSVEGHGNIISHLQGNFGSRRGYAEKCFYDFYDLGLKAWVLGICAFVGLFLHPMVLTHSFIHSVSFSAYYGGDTCHSTAFCRSHFFM